MVNHFSGNGNITQGVCLFNFSVSRCAFYILVCDYKYS